MTRMHTDIVSVKIRLIRVIRVPVFAALLCALGILYGVKHSFIYHSKNPRRQQVPIQPDSILFPSAAKKIPKYYPIFSGSP
jgi:hypothetical protein